jgi:hemerythrin-like domain-containing protein
MIALALEYCADYPGHYHHPVEDAVYSRLLQRMPRLKDRLVALDKDHKILAAMTESLSYAISKVIEGEPSVLARETGARFIRHYRQHMRIEEEEIFPAARQYLDPADWAAISADIALPRDPLFNAHVRKAYLALHRRLIQKRQESIC